MLLNTLLLRIRTINGAKPVTTMPRNLVPGSIKILVAALHFLNEIPYFCRHNKKCEITGRYLKETQMSITKERKTTIFADFGGAATNTGSIEAQVALLTERILDISKHLQVNKKDFSTQRGLMKMVGQRKRLLTYMQKHNLTGYRALIEKLGLRK